MNISVKIISLIILISTIISCQTTKNTTSVATVASVELTDDQKFEFEYNFFEANKFYLAGNMDMAITVFNQCLKLDKSSNVVHYKLASIYLINNDIEQATFHADQSIINSNNIWYLYLAGSIYAKSNQSDKALSVFQELIKINPKKMDYYLSVADVYLQINKLEEAIETYNTIDNLFGKSEVISLQKTKIYLAQNKTSSAVKELVSLAEFYNNDPQYLRLLADFYIQINQVDNALSIYNKMLLTNDNDGFANIGLAECYRLKGEYETSFTYLKKAFTSTELPSDLKISLVYNMIQNAQGNVKLQQEINLLIIALYEQYPEDNDVKILYINILLGEGNLESARELLREIVLIKRDTYGLWEQLVLLENEFQDWEMMYKESTEALTLFPTQSFLYFFKGFSSLQLEKYDDALEAFSFGYRLTTKEDPFRKDFISYLGETNYKLGNKEKAYSYFDDYLVLEPTNVGILNNYAYYLSIDSLNLDKAASMSKITVDKDPTNSTFLDTYAWVLFMQKEYSNSLVFIKQAVVYNLDNSSVIIEHYGDILFFNNDIDAAIIQWNKALEIDVSNEKLKSKISEKRYIP